MHNRFLRWLSIVSIVSLLLVLSASIINDIPSVHADTDGSCGVSSIPFYTGTLNPPKDTYDVYVKLGKSGQNAAVTAYAQFGNNLACRTIGSTDANSREWRKIGSYSDPDGSDMTTLQLSSASLADIPDANRPSLMLVSQTNPVCVPTVECNTTIAGQTAYIRPAGNALEEDALHIVRVDSVDLKNVTKVQYYIDNEMLYETTTLQDFKKEDIPFYAHKLIRVLQYQSGQTAVIETNAPEVSSDSLWSTIVRYAKKYQSTLQIVGGLILLVIVVRGVSLSLSYFERRKRWKIAHGFLKEEADLAVTPEQIKRLRRHMHLKSIYRYSEQGIVIVAVIAGLVFVSNAFFLQVGTVDGMSMYSTLHDGQKILVNKTPVTFARLNHTQYVPNRGDIVIASPNFGTIDSSLEQDGDSLIVKRVVGLPGERVVVKGQHLMVYNKENPNGFNPDLLISWSNDVQIEESTDFMDVTLGENEVFLAGDNRPVSIDSRFNGPISTTQIVGNVMWY